MKTMVAGIGNDLRSDDGVGLVAVRALKKLSLEEIVVVELNNDAVGLLECLKGCSKAIIIDAIRSGSRPGTIHRFDASDQPLPGSFTSHSTHGISLTSILELARSQGTLPPRVLVYGVEAESTAHGPALTPLVEQSLDRLLTMVRGDLQSERV